jgi:xanthine dehydrogenase accessory factor
MSATIYQHLKRYLGDGLPVAIATIVEVKGSVPREVGAKMIIHPYGQHVGTVGGGCGEADVIRSGLDVIQDGMPRNVHVDLTDAISMDSLGVCGGVMTVFVERWQADDGPKQALLDGILAAIEERRSFAVVTVTDAPAQGEGEWVVRDALVVDDDRGLRTYMSSALLDEVLLAQVNEALARRDHALVDGEIAGGPARFFVEVLAQPSHLVIAGAGHIAVPLAQIAKINDFDVTVLDDRPQYAHPNRFPTADRVIAGPFRSELQKLRGGRDRFDAHTYFVLVTRGHQHDIDCLLEVLDDPVAYIGMIGSQRRIRAVFELLEQEQGIAPEKFDGIYAPVGIDIGARTPAEIAVCIMAEIINAQRGGPAMPMSEQIRHERLARRARVAPT